VKQEPSSHSTPERRDEGSSSVRASGLDLDSATAARDFGVSLEGAEPPQAAKSPKTRIR